MVDPSRKIRPFLDNLWDLIEVYKPVLVQAFIPEIAVEALHVTIIYRFSGANELELDLVCISPGVHGEAKDFLFFTFIEK